MLRLFKSMTVPKRETQTIKMTKYLSEDEAYSLLRSKMTDREGNFGIECLKSKSKFEKYFFMSLYSEPYIEGEQVFKIVLPRDVDYRIYTASQFRASCFPFKINYEGCIWDKFNEIQVNEEIIFIQLLLKRVEGWQSNIKQQYHDWLNGIEYPTNIQPIRSLQYKALEFIKTKEEWDGKNPEIHGVEQKLNEPGFEMFLKFAVIGDKKSSRRIAKEVGKILGELNYANKWYIGRESHKSNSMTLLYKRTFPKIRRKQILCYSEILPFFCERNKSKAVEIIPEAVETVFEDNSSDDATDDFLSIFPKGNQQIKEFDVRLVEKLNSAFKKLNLIQDQNVVVQKIQQGATVQKITFSLPNGLKLTDLNTARKNIQTELALSNIGFEQGSDAGTVALSIPLEKRGMVYLRDCLEDEKFKEFVKKAEIPFVLGMNVEGEVIFEDLVRVKSLLISGTTGSGKSIFEQIIILTMLLYKNPSELQMILIDPKRVELGIYKKYPHVIDVITDMDKASETLIGVVNKMENRYEKFETKGYKNIQQYNRNEKDKLPYIVVVIDELADLLSTNKEVEDHIQRLAQKARAAGISLLITTQYPIGSVVTPEIKRNIVSRICFALDSGTAYRVVLDEKLPFALLGKGDGVYKFEGIQGIHRFQGAIIADTEEKQDDIILKMSKRWSGEFKKEVIEDVPKKVDDYEKLKQIIATTGETRIVELQKLMGIRINRIKDYFDKLVEEGWLRYTGIRSKGYELIIDEETKKKYLSEL
jgi:S-DNA-T family DNA segregation ATPase FtsK/SpoIIIE